jgi:hypothetical protein
MLVSRLERISVDSNLARRASGLRGNILKIIENDEAGESIPLKRMDLLIDTAFDILRRAAEDIPDLEALGRKK